MGCAILSRRTLTVQKSRKGLPPGGGAVWLGMEAGKQCADSNTMIHLNSSAIKAADYNPITKILRIWFPSGGPFNFYRVPSSVYQRLINSNSPGTYYNQNIRGNYSA